MWEITYKPVIILSNFHCNIFIYQAVDWITNACVLQMRPFLQMPAFLQMHFLCQIFTSYEDEQTSFFFMTLHFFDVIKKEKLPLPIYVRILHIRCMLEVHSYTHKHIMLSYFLISHIQKNYYTCIINHWLF